VPAPSRPPCRGRSPCPRLPGTMLPRQAAVVPVMWNMRKRHFSHSCKTPSARTAVKGARSLCVHRSEAETLDGCRSGGYARERVGMPVQSRSFALNRFATRNLRYLVRDRISLSASLHDGSSRDTKVPRQLPRRGGVSPPLPTPKAACSSGCWLRRGFQATPTALDLPGSEERHGHYNRGHN